MKNVRWITMASAGLALTLAANVHAAPLFTGSVRGAFGQTVACTATNADIGQDLEVELLEDGISIFGPTFCPNFAACEQAVVVGIGDDHRISCRVTAKSAKKVRVLVMNVNTGASSEGR
jgi:hypothetical protein